MCLPLAAVGVISAVASVASAAVSGVGAVLSANAQAAAGEAAQNQANENANEAERAAGELTTLGNIAAGQARTAGSKQAGDVRGAYAESGAAIGSGTAADQERQSEMAGEMDALTIRNNAAREAWGLKRDAAELRKSGKLARAAADSQVAGTLLGGAAQLAGGFANAGTMFAESRIKTGRIGRG